MKVSQNLEDSQKIYRLSFRAFVCLGGRYRLCEIDVAQNLAHFPHGPRIFKIEDSAHVLVTRENCKFRGNPNVFW